MSVTEGDSPDLFQYITKRGLENVCEDLFWEFRDGLPESDSEDSEESEESKWELKKKLSPSQLGRQTRRLLRERRNTVRDIMATLSLERTEDYRKDIFESPDDITIADIAMPGDLGGTFSKWFLYDDDAFFRFKPIVSHNKRASAYFSSEANEISEKESKKTIACEHITKALEQLGFGEYVPDIMEVASEHKEQLKGREKKANKLEQSGLSTEQLLAMQEEAFRDAAQRHG